MKVLKGTEFKLDNGTVVVLESQASISFPNSQDEASQIGFLQVTGNYQPTATQIDRDWPANSTLFKFRRDANGNLLPIDEQTEEGQTVDEFILKLRPVDATLFGVAERQTQLKAK